MRLSNKLMEVIILDNNIKELLEMVQEVNSYNGELEHLEFYEMDSFNEIMSGFDPLDIAMRICFGEFNPNDDYFEFNGYANLVSLSFYDLKNELLDYENEIRESYNELFE